MGFPDSDAELPGRAWFDVPKFPQATFRSSAVKGLGGGRFEVAGKLAIKGTSRDLVVPVVIAQAGGVSTASGEFTVKRLDFRIGDDEWADPGLVATTSRSASGWFSWG